MVGRAQTLMVEVIVRTARKRHTRDSTRAFVASPAIDAKVTKVFSSTKHLYVAYTQAALVAFLLLFLVIWSKNPPMSFTTDLRHNQHRRLHPRVSPHNYVCGSPRVRLSHYRSLCSTPSLSLVYLDIVNKCALASHRSLSFLGVLDQATRDFKCGKPSGRPCSVPQNTRRILRHLSKRVCLGGVETPYPAFCELSLDT